MKIQDLIEHILAGSPELGTFTLQELLRFAQTRGTSGIAVVHGQDREFYLAIIGGEPDGAVFVDEKGTLYGDKAVILVTGQETFVLYDVKPDIVETVAMGCRIFEKSHLKTGRKSAVPEIGMKSQGIGVLTLAVRHRNEPQNGVRVSLRRDGEIAGSDITTGDGSVSFRVMHGKYECTVQDRQQKISTFPVLFDAIHSYILLELK